MKTKHSKSDGKQASSKDGAGKGAKASAKEQPHTSSEKVEKVVLAKEQEDGEADAQLLLEDVIELGGDKEDYEWLKDFDDSKPPANDGRDADLQEIVDAEAPAGNAAASEATADSAGAKEKEKKSKTKKNSETGDASTTKTTEANKTDPKKGAEATAAQPSGTKAEGKKAKKSEASSVGGKPEETKKGDAKKAVATAADAKHGSQPAAHSEEAAPAPVVPAVPKVVLPPVRAPTHPPRARTQLLITEAIEMPGDVRKEGDPAVSDTVAASWFAYAQEVLKHEMELYEQKQGSSHKGADSAWLTTILRSGTLGDKLAAIIMRVQESPVHRNGYIDTLLNMTHKKGKREALLAIDSLKELWVTTLLPDRKLISFNQRPFHSILTGGDRNRDTTLLLWFFEDLLKKRYQDYVKVVEAMTKDAESNIKIKVLGGWLPWAVLTRPAGVVIDLLSQKPEQEKFLLSTLVNKLGDPDRKIASKTAHFLTRLLSQHPNMKLVVAKEVEVFLCRPHIAPRAQYYGVCFLNQLELHRTDTQLANKLISVYFHFFESFVKRGEVEARMLSGLLTGVNRAFKFAQFEEAGFEKHIDTMFKVVHVGTFNCSVQALMLLFQIMDSRSTVSDRFYRALYEKLADPNLIESSKQGLFLNLLFRSLKSDPIPARIKAFAKRLLQVCAHHQPGFVCGALLMLSELMKIAPSLRALIDQQEDNDVDEEHYEDAPDSEEEGPAKSTEKPVSNAEKKRRLGAYDPSHRDPRFSGAERSSLWELTVLLHYYHPSVVAFAKCLLAGKPIVYKGDPLLDFTLIRFLDRFIYKNPKQKKSDHGGSVMQPKTTSSRANEMPVNSESFLSQREENVRQDELFFYRFFKTKEKSKAVPMEEQPLDDLEIDAALEAEPANFASSFGLEGGEESDEGMDFETEDAEDAGLGAALAGDDSEEEGEAGEGDSDDLEGGEFDYDDMDGDMGDVSDEGELDLEKIARQESDEEDGGAEIDGDVFADADDFAQLIEGSAAEEKSMKRQMGWEDRNNKRQRPTGAGPKHGGGEKLAHRGELPMHRGGRRGRRGGRGGRGGRGRR